MVTGDSIPQPAEPSLRSGPPHRAAAPGPIDSGGSVRAAGVRRSTDTARLAAYWAEALGGPPAYTSGTDGSESHVQRLHAGEGAYTAMATPRFVRCVVDSFDEAGVPEDAAVRGAITAYLQWVATGPFQAWPDSADDVPDDLPMPLWGWDGPT